MIPPSFDTQNSIGIQENRMKKSSIFRLNTNFLISQLSITYLMLVTLFLIRKSLIIKQIEQNQKLAGLLLSCSAFCFLLL